MSQMETAATEPEDVLAALYEIALDTERMTREMHQTITQIGETVETLKGEIGPTLEQILKNPMFRMILGKAK